MEFKTKASHPLSFYLFQNERTEDSEQFNGQITDKQQSKAEKEVA